MSVIATAWFDQCKTLEMHQAIWLRVANKAEQVDLANALERERSAYSKVDPVHASQLFINKTLMNHQQYVTIERKFRTPYTAFFKNEHEILSKITIDPERHRIIRLMIKDGKPRKEVEETLNGLTEEEIGVFYPEKE